MDQSAPFIPVFDLKNITSMGDENIRAKEVIRAFSKVDAIKINATSLNNYFKILYEYIQ